MIIRYSGQFDKMIQPNKYSIHNLKRTNFENCKININNHNNSNSLPLYSSNSNIFNFNNNFNNRINKILFKSKY